MYRKPTWIKWKKLRSGFPTKVSLGTESRMNLNNNNYYYIIVILIITLIKIAYQEREGDDL